MYNHNSGPPPLDSRVRVGEMSQPLRHDRPYTNSMGKSAIRTHSRNTSWSSCNPSGTQHQGMYMHGNFTVGNVASPSPGHTTTNTVPSAAASRRSRVDRIYGARNGANSGAVPPPLQTHLETSKYAQSAPVSPADPLPKQAYALPSQLIASQQHSSQHNSYHKHRISNSMPQPPHPLPQNHSKSATQLPNLAQPNLAQPNLANQEQHGHQRNSSSGFLSRISTSISSGFSSGFSSRLSSRISSGLSSRLSSRNGSSMSMYASSGLNGSTGAEPKPAIMDLVLEEEDWPEYFPRREPSSTVVDQLVTLGESGMAITDLDMNARCSPQSHLPLTAPDAIEARGFAPRGLFFYSEHSGNTDEEGNYHHIEGEQIGFRYSVVDTLGKGSFGTVLRCRDHKSGRMVAVKVTTRRPELQSQVKIEASLLRALLVDHHGHPESNHFVRYVEHFRFRGHMCIATELLGPNLYEILKRNKHQGLQEATVRYITRQLCEGLEFLASRKIIHCDIKPENILLSDLAKCQVKIVDFGSGCYEGRRLYTYIQSRFYRAPEILLGMPYGPAIDMWSLGALVPELLLGRPLFWSVDEPDQVVLMAQVLGRPDNAVLWRSSRSALFFDHSGMPWNLKNSRGDVRQVPGSTPLRHLLQRFSTEAIDFCESALKWAPEQRLKAEKAVYHPFVISQ